MFKVVEILDSDSLPFLGNAYYDNPIFLLKDTLTQQNVFFIYNPWNEYLFPFLISQEEIDSNIFCSRIEKKSDDFTNEVSYSTPFYEGKDLIPLVFYKIIKGGNKTYYLSLTANGNTVVVDGKGVIILFEDGTKINKPNVKIEVNAKSDGYEYSAFFPLTVQEIQFLKNKKITNYRLYIFDNKLNKSFAEKLKYYSKCLLEIK